MCSAVMMSALVIGQFGNWFEVTIRMKSLVLGHPILIWISLALKARL
jgi:hypothetical protein